MEPTAAPSAPPAVAELLGLLSAGDPLAISAVKQGLGGDLAALSREVRLIRLTHQEATRPALQDAIQGVSCTN